MKFPFFKEVGDRLVCNAHEVIIYIDKSYFDRKIAIELGESVATVGVFPFEVKSGEKAKMIRYQMEAPLVLQLSFTDSMIVDKDFGDGNKKYKALVVRKGDTLIKNLNHTQTVDSFNGFTKFFNEGKMPKGVPYSSLLGMFTESASINKFNIGVPSILVEAMVSELCRVEGDDSTPFRQVAGKTGQDDGFDMIPVKKIAEVSSVFAALSFENINQSIATSVRKTREGARQSESPVEKLIHY